VCETLPSEGEIVYSKIFSLQNAEIVSAVSFYGSCLWLRDGKGQDLASPVSNEDQFLQNEEKKAVVCRNCGHPITSADSITFIDGSQTHTFFNPAGIVFEIICFSRAPGCFVFGTASTEFSWFSGFTWRGALCGSCRIQLGWCFESGDSSFFGLILQKLIGDI
jgi:hypothetical protein